MIDLKKYRLPEDKEKMLNISSIFPAVKRKAGSVDFDIYDYEMLFNDEKTKAIIREGRTIGCFYIESPGMRSLLQKLNCDTFEMLTAASSVIRPGVAESGMMQEFITRHKNPLLRKYLVPEMENVLGETYGVMIYQEDVIKVAHHVAGLSLEEADLLRRAMSGKMRSKEAMKSLGMRFYETASQKGLAKPVIKELWRQIESFAGYAFCKAHSASFALLSFQVAYLKAHYPAEFLASVLSNRGGYYTPAVYIQEAKRLGLKVLLPCVNKSQYEYTGSGSQIRVGLMAVKNLSKSSISKITEKRKSGDYVSLLDFLLRTGIGYEETADLIRCGALGCFKKTRPALMRLLDIYIRHREMFLSDINNLFVHENLNLENEVITDEQYSLEKICAIEYETFGFMVTRHPLQFFEKIVKEPVVKAKDMGLYNNKTVKMLGWYMTSKRIRTKKGDIMKFLSLEDLTGTYEAVLFPNTYSLYAEQTLAGGAYIVEGKVDMENGNNLVVEKLKAISAGDISADKMWDSTENSYYGDIGPINAEEFTMAGALNEKIISALGA